jgi:signal transduction histidine kinase
MPFSRRRSLAVKLPLLVSVLLLLALAAMSVASYVELRRALIDMATGRLTQAADQMSNVFAMVARQRVTAMTQLMRRPEVYNYLLTRDAALAPQLESAARSYLGTAVQIGSVELWDANGTRIFVAGIPFEEITGPRLEEFKAGLQSTDDAAIGRLRQSDGGISYPVGGRVSDNGKVIGYVVERRSISNPAQTRQVVALLTGLIGNQATMVIGNADGSMWSDLAAVSPNLRIIGDQGRLWDYQRTGMPRTLAWAAPIPSTPWAVAIEFPREVVLEPSGRFVMRSVVIATTVLLAAAAIGLVLSRRITTPLVRVTEAAEAVAESRSLVRVEVDREDEIGRLADSFNAMAKKVELGRLDLELRVETQTSELRAANRELEAFSYSVSHDLRAPLRAIAGFVQILEEDHSAALDPTARHHLQRVRINAHRMGELIDDLLAFSRIGRSTMLRQHVDVAAMARAAAEEAIAASGRAIDLTIEPLPPCQGEAALLNQVFANLLSNAVKFTSKVEHPAITIGSTPSGSETAYFVRDNGVGFDDRYAEKLFGVFQRLHRSDEFEGTGVGLAIVHRIITRHGGRVWAEGRINGGATFYFTMPSCASVTEGNPSSFAKATEDK